jgi:hypothetical protein
MLNSAAAAGTLLLYDGGQCLLLALGGSACDPDLEERERIRAAGSYIPVLHGALRQCFGMPMAPEIAGQRC